MTPNPLMSNVMFHRSAASVALLAVLTWVCSAQAWQDPLFPVDGRFVLSPTAGPKLLTQCSRDTPKGASEYWEPSVSEVTELESALPRFLVSLKQRGARIPPLTHSYHRQYVGFVKDGVRFIYGSFYPRDMPFRKGESSTPLIVCDGGLDFWGIAYRVDTHEFEEPKMNGAI